VLPTYIEGLFYVWYGSSQSTIKGPKSKGGYSKGAGMKRILPIALAVIGLLVAVLPASAHHSFAAEFDANKCSDITGILTTFEWQNPHAYFHLDAREAGGDMTSWTFETVSLSTLKRSGTTRRDFIDNVGKTVTVRACLAKNGMKNRAAAETIKLSDGQVHRIGQDVEGKFGDSPRE
jgi:hypothetical protein